MISIEACHRVEGHISTNNDVYINNINCRYDRLLADISYRIENVFLDVLNGISRQFSYYDILNKWRFTLYLYNLNQRMSILIDWNTDHIKYKHKNLYFSIRKKNPIPWWFIFLFNAWTWHMKKIKFDKWWNLRVNCKLKSWTHHSHEEKRRTLKSRMNSIGRIFEHNHSSSAWF